MIEIKLVS